MKKVFAIGTVLVIITVVLLFLAINISKVKLERVDLAAADIKLGGVDFGGELLVNNSGLLEIPVKSVKYIVYVTNSSDTAVNGEIDKFKLSRKQAMKVPFEQSISWTEAAMLASEMAQEGKYLIVEGDIHLQKWWLVRYKIHFEQFFDVKDYFPVSG